MRPGDNGLTFRPDVDGPRANSAFVFAAALANLTRLGRERRRPGRCVGMSRRPGTLGRDPVRRGAAGGPTGLPYRCATPGGEGDVSDRRERGEERGGVRRLRRRAAPGRDRRLGRWRRPVSPASEAQRAKVAGRACLVCRRRPADPAHLVPRSLGGCDDRDCVVALCRGCHRAFDERSLDLLPYLEPGCRLELAHAVGHLSLVALLERLTGEGWRPRQGAEGAGRDDQPGGA